MGRGREGFCRTSSVSLKHVVVYMDSKDSRGSGSVWQEKYDSFLHRSHFKNHSNMETALLPY